MTKHLLSFFLLISLCSFGQILTKERIIYEYKDQLVMNDGVHYKILVSRPFYQITDTTIPQLKEFQDHVLRLNRVLILRSDEKYAQLIEWVKEKMKYYELRSLDNYNSDSNLSENN